MKRSLLIVTVAAVGVLILLVAMLPVLLGPVFSTARTASTERSIAEICSAGEPGQAQIPDKYREDVANAAEVSGISQEIIASQIFHESRWQEDAVSSSDARGLAQFKAEAWSRFGNGGDRFNGHDSIAAQGRLLAFLKNEFKPYADGDDALLVKLILIGYNVGYDKVHKAQGVPPGSSGINYAEKIMAGSAVYTTDCAPAPETGGEGVVVSGEWTHPFPGAYFTSDYGPRPCPKTLKCTKEVANHNAIDLATGTGTGFAVAPTQMEITKANGTDRDGDHPVFARQIAEPHYVISYWHCAYGSHRVKTGQIVEAGTPICQEGITGNAGGRPHVHLQFNKPSASDTSYERYTTVDPEPILAANGVDLCPPGRNVTGPCQGR
ncbi:murein DD-endopeptidase MepM/ murein hydrolase activator NlpD [Micrococcus cohnii]|uniref:Murein DD-endopeptidase MepM/ murein hydrolase activator NlpD n=1 Tax=Micrococcus cohnii TaxID=993416 RepID=A0A7W7M264_9MICC|nr:transglycosylase SLT domain-containing protein [Micrococcus cohnii]MBB4734776.1 murein DD-endopeptidase MepM/ murein hydrolase activator NlpD [Micrococcus cohnii]